MSEITAGAVTGTFGIHGELRVKPLVQDVNLIKKGKKVALEDKDGNRSEVKILSVKLHKDSLLVKLDGVLTPEEAALKRGSIIKISLDELPEANENEVYWIHIEGAKVIDSGGSPVGTLADYVETGTTDAFVIAGDDGKEYMISNNPHHVLEINPQTKTVTVNRDGLVEQE